MSTNREAVGVEIAKMLAAFPTQEPGQTASLRIDAYFEALGDFPFEAVEVARVKVVRGVVPGLNRAFAPTPAQFAEIVRGLLASAPTMKDDRVSYDGEIPVTWVLGDDPNWKTLCAMRAKRRPGSRAYPRPSKYAKGMGWFFETADVERLRSGPAGKVEAEPSPQERERVAAGFDRLKAEYGDDRTAHQVYEDAMAGLRSRALANGVDFDAAMDALPDQPERQGSFGRLKA